MANLAKALIFKLGESPSIVGEKKGMPPTRRINFAARKVSRTVRACILGNLIPKKSAT